MAESSLPRFGKDDELKACVEPAPDEKDMPLDEEDAERHPEWTPSLRERLMAQARSWEHQLTFFPKNRYCEVCKRSKMTAKVHKSHVDGPDPEETPPLHFGHKLCHERPSMDRLEAASRSVLVPICVPLRVSLHCTMAAIPCQGFIEAQGGEEASIWDLRLYGLGAS